MKSAYFIVIVLVSGFTAGIIHGAVNLVIVEPYLDQAISIENQNLFATGLAEDTPQFWAEYSSYRDWQKSGQLLAGGILGMSIGALFGIVFAYSRNALPKGHTVKKTFVLASNHVVHHFSDPFFEISCKSSNSWRGGDSCTQINTLSYIYCNFGFFSCWFFYSVQKTSKQKEGFCICQLCGFHHCCIFYNATKS